MKKLNPLHLLLAAAAFFWVVAAPLRASEVDSAATTVMVMFEEKIAGIFQTTAYEDMGQAESLIIERLVDAGFNVLDPRSVKANIARDQALRILEGDDLAAASAGIRFGAQVVITGKALSKQAGSRLQGTKMQSVQGVVSIRAIQSDDARIISVGNAQAAAAHLDEVQGGVQAVRKATEQALTTVIQDMLFWRSAEHLGRSSLVTVMITNLVSYRHLSFVKNFFEQELPGVHALHQRSYTMGTAELALEYSGQVAGIAEDLAHRRFPGFRLEPTNVTATRLDLRAVLD